MDVVWIMGVRKNYYASFENGSYPPTIFASDRDMIKKMTDNGFYLLRANAIRTRVDFVWKRNKLSMKFNYKICLGINCHDFRVFDGTQETNKADPTPEKIFSSAYEMWDWFGDEWKVQTITIYPYDGWSRYILVQSYETEIEDGEETNSKDEDPVFTVII